MDLPVTNALSGVSALQALLLGRGTSASQTAALTAMVGQDLDMLLQAVLPESVQLRLPSGQSILAQGQLPYPQGTQLRVRILPASDETGLRLQTLEARPPAQPSLLAPLLQGEASSLLSRLSLTNPAPDLWPLIQLMNRFSKEPSPVDSPPLLKPSAQVPGQAPPLKDAAPSAKGAVPAELPRGASALSTQASALSTQAKAAEYLPERAVAEQPDSWEAWVKGSLKTLGDPAVSPREAPFHIAQSKEGTGFFEVPMPWPQAGNLQIWVESDAQKPGLAREEPVQRVLLGLNFSRLGETRLGLAKGPFGIQVRIWAEHPEVLNAERERMESELKTLGSAVDLQIQSLPQGAPSLRALATGPTLQALG